MPSRSAKWLRRPFELPASSTSTGGASSSRPPLRRGSICCGRRAPAPDANPCARVPGRPARSDRPCARAAPRRVDTESLLADAAQQRQRGVGHASRGGLRALRVHVHVGAKEHGFGRAGRGGAQIDGARPAPAAPVASRPARVAWVARRAGRKAGRPRCAICRAPRPPAVAPAADATDRPSAASGARARRTHARRAGAQAVAVEQPARAAHGDLVAQVSQQAIAQRCVPGIERVLRGQAQRAVQRAAGRAVQPGRRRHVGRLEAGVGQSPDAPTQAEREQQAGDDGVAAMPGGLRLVR